MTRNEAIARTAQVLRQSAAFKHDRNAVREDMAEAITDVLLAHGVLIADPLAREHARPAVGEHAPALVPIDPGEYVLVRNGHESEWTYDLAHGWRYKAGRSCVEPGIRVDSMTPKQAAEWGFRIARTNPERSITAAKFFLRKIGASFTVDRTDRPTITLYRSLEPNALRELQARAPENTAIVMPCSTHDALGSANPEAHDYLDYFRSMTPGPSVERRRRETGNNDDGFDAGGAFVRYEDADEFYRAIKQPRHARTIAEAEAFLRLIGASYTLFRVQPPQITLHRPLESGPLNELRNRAPEGTRINVTTSATPPRCVPPPERRRAGTWHWIERANSYRCPAQWFPNAPQEWSIAGRAVSAKEMTNMGWRYVAPCEEPKP